MRSKQDFSWVVISVQEPARHLKVQKSLFRLTDQRIKDPADWRGITLVQVRAPLKQALPDAVEEWKWRGLPVWFGHGIFCTGETKMAAKLTFAKGTPLADPAKLFNASLEGNIRRAIDLHKGDRIDEPAFQTPSRAAEAAHKPEFR
jgi:hypothetical protein